MMLPLLVQVNQLMASGPSSTAPVSATPPAAAAEPQSAANARTAQAPAPKPARSAAKAPAGKALPTITVYKSPTCGCCAVWVEHLRSAGMSVVVRDHDDLELVGELGLPGECIERDAQLFLRRGARRRR